MLKRRPISLALRAVALLLPVAILNCASHRVLVPPRLDLVPYGRIGLVTFTVENAKGTLHEFATRRFEEEVLSAQTGYEILELGSADSVLRRARQAELGAAVAESLGGQRNVAAVFFGHIRISNIQPSGGLLGIAAGLIEANVSAELSVELVSAKTGGTLWRASGVASEKVGSVSLAGGVTTFSARDPNVAYGRLVNRLVAFVTRDFRPTWVKQ